MIGKRTINREPNVQRDLTRKSTNQTKINQILLKTDGSTRVIVLKNKEKIPCQKLCQGSCWYKCEGKIISTIEPELHNNKIIEVIRR